MSGTQSTKILSDLINELNQIARRLEQGNAAAMPMELALMSQKTITLYNEIKRLEQGSQEPIPVTVPQPQASRTPAPEPVRPPVAASPANETQERRPAGDQLERKREKLQRMEEAAAPAPVKAAQEQAVSAPPAPKKSAVSDIYAQAWENAGMQGSKSINEKLRGATEPKASLNEKFAGTQVKKNLVDKLKLSPIANLGAAMSVNQKALFTQNLFKGDDKEFKRVVAFVNGSSNFSEAKFYLQSEVGPIQGWRDDDPLVQEFLELVYRKFL